MVRTLFCKHCRFKWKPRTETAPMPARCGNCGTVGSVCVEPDANQILREADEMDFRTRGDF